MAPGRSVARRLFGSKNPCRRAPSSASSASEDSQVSVGQESAMEWKGEVEVLQSARLNLRLQLGGLVALRGPSDEAADVVFKHMVGLHVPQRAGEMCYLPLFLRYTYCPENPVLFEGQGLG